MTQCISAVDLNNILKGHYTGLHRPVSTSALRKGTDMISLFYVTLNVL